MPSSSLGPDAIPEPDISDLGTEEAPQEASVRGGGSLFHTAPPGVISPLTLVFVRHGVTDMTLTHCLSGSSKPGPKLNAEGRAQANAAADALYRMGRDRWRNVPTISRVLASPMVRTQETGRAIGMRLGVDVETDVRLREAHFGLWEGRTGHEIAEQYGDEIHQWRFGEIPAPGGESIPEVGERVDGLVRELAREHVARCAAGDDARRAYALASHAVAIKAIVGLSMEMDPRMWGSIWPRPASVTILELRVDPKGEIAERHLLCLGETSS
ncbi:MAG: histidine phosphatase family protein [Demequinaceae bacterium]|nr:histidine phosphatase family protein [Demequinaceae bacterium]